MVLGFIADVVLGVTFWSGKKVYNVGHWLVWGKQKSETEKMLEKQNKTIEILHNDLLKLNEKMEKMQR